MGNKRKKKSTAEAKMTQEEKPRTPLQSGYDYGDYVRNDIILKALFDWFFAHRGRISNSLELTSKNGLRGFYVRSNIEVGEPLLLLPSTLSIREITGSLLDLKYHELVKNIEIPTTHTNLILFLMYCNATPDCFFRPYIDSLPRHIPNYLDFTEEVLQMLNYNYFYEKLKYWHEFDLQLWDAIEKIAQENPDKFPKEYFTYADFRWARSIVVTRSWGDAMSSVMLTPLLDMLNHHYDATMGSDHTETHDTYFMSDKSYSIGDQLFCTYGQRDNKDLLSTYGFIIPGNPVSSFTFQATLNFQACNSDVDIENYFADNPERKAKMEAFMEDMASPTSFNANILLQPDCMQNINFVMMAYSQFEVMNLTVPRLFELEDDPVMIYSGIHHALSYIQDILSSVPSTEEEDVCLLNASRDEGLPSEEMKRCALEVRIQDRQTLQKLITYFNKLLVS